MNTDKIRNFCIIAHIDHGKSTLADRMMEITDTVAKREMKAQLLDSMELEREKGITIKLTPVQMHYKGYELNLIDTPGHVDFSYEVSRSLQAVESAILVVDATQGIQAQTLANVYLALEQDLYIIPVINKIDLPAADVEKVQDQIINLLGCDRSDIIGVSAKTGLNVEKVLDRIIEKAPSPKVSETQFLGISATTGADDRRSARNDGPRSRYPENCCSTGQAHSFSDLFRPLPESLLTLHPCYAHFFAHFSPKFAQIFQI